LVPAGASRQFSGGKIDGQYDDDGPVEYGHAWDGDAEHVADGGDDAGAGRAQLPDGAALHYEGGKVHGRLENQLRLRRCRGLQYGAKPMLHAGRRYVLVLLLHEWPVLLLLQLHDGHVQVRSHSQGRVHHLHQRRCRMLQDAARLLRLPLGHAPRRLYVLRDAEQHPCLLRLLLRIEDLTSRPFPQKGRGFGG